MKTRLIHITPEAEKHIAYCARVSNPKNQDNEDIGHLISYCAKHGHWSIFEMASICVEIKTTRAISAQILRHKSFSFQEFSQRYAEATSFAYNPPRRQDSKNRQNSLDDLPEDTKREYRNRAEEIFAKCHENYEWALSQGVAKECARDMLPLSTETTMYMHGTIRSFIHYLQVRTDLSTQKEHRDIANKIKIILETELPTVYQAVFGETVTK